MKSKTAQQKTNQ